MRLGLFAFLVATIAAAPAWADFDWLPFARVSQTMTVSPSRLCMGASENTPGRHNVIGCPSYAPSITTGGDVSITGNVSANKFIGDGSGLTGVTAGSSDRIVSGTTSMVAISNTGYISLTQSGVNTGWFNPQTGFVTIGVSSTGVISGTGGYFVGPTATDIVRFSDGTRRGSVYINGNGIWLGSLSSGVPTIIAANNNGNLHAYESQGTYMGDYAGRMDPGYNNVIIGNRLGVGRVAPTATLQVSGTFIVSNSSQVTTPSIYVSSGGNVGIGTSVPATSLDVSGSVIARGTGYAGYALYAANGGGVYSDGPIDSANGNYRQQASGNDYFFSNSGVRSLSFMTSSTYRVRIAGSGNVSIGPNIAPSQTLHVQGTLLTTSWTGINFSSYANVTPTAPLEVSGTISATNLVINGQSITGGGGDRITSGTSSVVVNSATSTISFSTAGSQRMTIDGSGNVGIGTTAPATKLDISGVVSVTGVDLDGGSLGGVSAAWHSASTKTRQFLFNRPEIGTTVTDGTYFSVGGDGLFTIDNQESAGVRIATADIERVRIDSAGNMGVGTASPNQTLDVSGTARIASSTAIGMNATPSATLDVSGSLKIAGTGNEVCDANSYGTMRKNPATGEMELCVP